MGFGRLKESVEIALKEAVQSEEFKESVKTVVTTTLNESSELIEKIVETKIDNKE